MNDKHLQASERNARALSFLANLISVDQRAFQSADIKSCYAVPRGPEAERVSPTR